MVERFRFRAPRLAISHEARWLFRRAFGPVEARYSDDLDHQKLLQMGSKLDLIARIAARTPHATLRDEIGSTAAATFADWLEATAVQQSSLRQAAHQLAGVAREVGAPIIFLKGMALHLAGFLTPGARPMGDIDVLLARDAAARIKKRMISHGWCEDPRNRDREGPQGHLNPLHDAHGRVIELHTVLWGVCNAHGVSFTAGDLEQRGLVHPVHELGGHCMIPSPDACTAHLLFHGIAQHGNFPRGYAPARLLCDLADLGWTQQRWQEFFEGPPFGWIAHAVGRREAASVVSLACRLKNGEDPQIILSTPDDAARYLGHLVAVIQSQHYDGLLRLRRIREQGVLRFLLKRALPSNQAVRKQLRQPAAGPLAICAWHLWRPVRLSYRFIRWGLGAVLGR